MWDLWDFDEDDDDSFFDDDDDANHEECDGETVFDVDDLCLFKVLDNDDKLFELECFFEWDDEEFVDLDLLLLVADEEWSVLWCDVCFWRGDNWGNEGWWSNDKLFEILWEALWEPVMEMSNILSLDDSLIS